MEYDLLRKGLFGLVSQLPEAARMSVLKKGFIIPSSEEGEICTVSEAISSFDLWGENRADWCHECNVVMYGLYEDFWQVDDTDGFLAHLCNPCALKHFTRDYLIALTPGAVMELLTQLRAVDWTLVLRPGVGPSVATAEAVAALNRCSFGDEDVHVHRIDTIKSNTLMEGLTMFEYRGAWLMSSLTYAFIIAPTGQLQADDEDFYFLETVATKLRSDSYDFIECQDWIDRISVIGDGSFKVSQECSYSYGMSFTRALYYFVHEHLADADPGGGWKAV